MSNFVVNSIKGIIQLVLVIAFVVGAFAASAYLKTSAPEVEQTQRQDREFFVETQRIKKQPHRITFETTAVIEALTEINVVPQVSGRVVSVNPDFYEGGSFNRNERLFQIERRDFQLEVDRLAAEVARAQTALQLEEAESQAAIGEWRLRNGDQPVPDLVARRPQLDEARANLKAAKALLEIAELNLARTSFTMPFDGRVISSDVATGQFINAGQSVGTVFDINTLEARASLDAEELKWLLATDEANSTPQITLTATYMGQTNSYNAYLKRGTASLDPQTRFARVSFGLDDPKDLLPGVFAKVQIKGPMMPNVMLLPPSSIQKNGVVWALDQNMTLLKLEPNIIYATEDYVAATGLIDNFPIVTSRLEGAQEGMKVKTSENNNANTLPSSSFEGRE